MKDLQNDNQSAAMTGAQSPFAYYLRVFPFVAVLFLKALFFHESFKPENGILFLSGLSAEF